MTWMTALDEVQSPEQQPAEFVLISWEKPLGLTQAMRTGRLLHNLICLLIRPFLVGATIMTTVTSQISRYSQLSMRS